MTAQTIFYLIIGILLFDFILEKFLDYLNARHYNDKIPSELQDVYDVDEYKKSQAYKLTNNKFGNISSLFSILLTLGFLFFDGFKIVDDYARTFTDNNILIALIFFGIIMLDFDFVAHRFYSNIHAFLL